MDVREAADKAAKYLVDFFPDAERVQLEEVEITDDDKFWNITLSYESPDTASGYIMIGKTRKFKTIKIGTDNGEVRAMKIRDFK